MNEPIPFITVVNGGGNNDDRCPRFAINPKAAELLSAVQGPVGVVTVAGLYRTGKSYVLNRLAGSNRGFAVGSLVEPCTQGIYMWIIHDPPPELAALRKSPNMTLLLLDTEGLGSFTKSKQYDVKIFTLAVLLSSLFCYNSLGSVDEGALDRLALVAELSNHIRLTHASEAGAEETVDAYALNKFFPKFVWLVRDFVLKLELDGVSITSDEYLESVLKPIEGEDSEKLKTRNGIRSSIQQYFPDRHCFTLKRPVNDEKMLQHLDDLTESDIRPVFLEQMRSLTEFVYASTLPKQLFGRTLSGDNFAHLAAAYVNAMNSGGVPVIRSAWEAVIAAECERVVATAATEWEKLWTDQVLAKLPLEEDALVDAFYQCHDTVMRTVRRFIVDRQVGPAAAEAIESKLLATMRKAYKTAQEVNLTKSQRQCEAVLADVHTQLVTLVNSDTATVDRYAAELHLLVREKIESAPLGPAKHASLATYLTTRVVAQVQALHARSDAVRDHEVAAERLRREESADRDRANHDVLLRDLRASFVASRAEVEQLATENQALITVVTKFSHLMDDGDLGPMRGGGGGGAKKAAGPRV
ncbi:guanylate-binding protein [Blastocladiella britannica]|nr:guanylate-binding protein [Blastocladiella britannica]